jgi:predicted nucleic acid-binding protein
MLRLVADTGPLNYLPLTGDSELLPKLFERVLVPQAVRDEFADGDAPARAWIAQTPPWLEVRPNPDPLRQDATTPKLDEGEHTAIALAIARREASRLDIVSSELKVKPARPSISPRLYPAPKQT